MCADSDADVSGLLPDASNITYVRPVRRLAVGPKRNFACRQARGEIIVHFDDDDWSASGRIMQQVEALLGHPDAAVAGYRSILFFRARDSGVWRFSASEHRPYAVGTSLCYRRAWWLSHQFSHRNVGEDNDFVRDARARRALLVLPGEGMMVARWHGANTSPHPINPVQYRRVTMAALPEGFPQ